jgi:hypothetical protein
MCRVSTQITGKSTSAGCVGQLRRTARGFVAYDANDKPVGIFADTDHAAQALLDQQSNGRFYAVRAMPRDGAIIFSDLIGKLDVMC